MASTNGCMGDAVNMVRLSETPVCYGGKVHHEEEVWISKNSPQSWRPLSSTPWRAVPIRPRMHWSRTPGACSETRRPGARCVHTCPTPQHTPTSHPARPRTSCRPCARAWKRARRAGPAAGPEGAQRYPAHAELQRYARCLLPLRPGSCLRPPCACGRQSQWGMAAHTSHSLGGLRKRSYCISPTTSPAPWPLTYSLT